MRVLAVCGSLSATSGNLSLLKSAASLAPLGVEVVVFDGLRELPHFNPDLEVGGTPASVEAWRQAIRECDAVLIATPEYGHSLPGALKNAIDWLIGSGELYQKQVAITSAVASRARGQRGLAALRQGLLAVDARVVGGVPIELGPGFERELSELLRELVAPGAIRASGARTEVAQGDLFWIAASDSGASAPHPHVVVQEDVFNRSRISTVVLCALTTNLGKASEPGNVLLEVGEGDLPQQSVVVVSQILSVERSQLGERIGRLAVARVEQILAGIRFQQAAFFGER